MARPPKDPTDKLTHRIYVRFGADGVVQCKAQASAKNLSVSDYIRELVERDGVSSSDQFVPVAQNDSPFTPFQLAIIDAVNRIGNNHNQLVKKFHGTGREPQQLRPNLLIVNKILNRIFDI